MARANRAWLDRESFVKFNKPLMPSLLQFLAFSLALSSAVPAGAAQHQLRLPLKGLQVTAPSGTGSQGSGGTGAAAPDTPSESVPAPTRLGQVSPLSLDFGDVIVGQAPATRVVTFRNIGTGSLTLAAPQVSGAGFSVSGTCGGLLSPGVSCTADVAFSPAQEGYAPGAVLFVSNAEGSPVTVSLSGTAKGPADSYFSQVSLLMPFEGGLSDLSKSPSAPSQIGTLAYAAEGAFGNHLMLSGAGGVRIAHSAKLDLPQDFTLEMRVMLTAPATSWMGLYGQQENSVGYRPMSLDVTPTGAVSLALGNTSLTGWQTVLTSSTTLPVGAWSTIAVTRAGSSVRMFVNGQLVQSGTYASALPSYVAPVVVGAGLRYGGAAAYQLKGKLDELRLTKGVARDILGAPVATRPFPSY